MITSQWRWTTAAGWSEIPSRDKSLQIDNQKVDLVLVFASPETLSTDALQTLSVRFPNASIVGGSSAGNVLDITCSDDDMVATAVSFSDSWVKTLLVEIPAGEEVSSRVNAAAESLLDEQLKHILIFSDGLNINGSELARALNTSQSVPVSGGLMGDNGRFKETFVIAGGKILSHAVVLIGFYGDLLSVGHGCFAGWDEFGINRKITKSMANVVYEIDGEPALQLYRKYLGNFADELPASGLRFPLSIKDDDGTPLIRTLLAVDEDAQSLTFAGDVPEGSTTLLMRGITDNLIDGAGIAAGQASIAPQTNGLAIIISCVGRRMLMDQLAEDELEAVKDVLGDSVAQTGFYSYGELAPFGTGQRHCKLHNQTMTLVTLYE